ncbi:MAG: hypothetical protein EOO80_18330, partial [Oxalobacteraceae bacterium]
MNRSIIIGAAVALLVLSACATTTESGVRFGIGAGHGEGYRATPATPPGTVAPSALGTAAAQLASKARSDVIVVGETGVLTALDPAERTVFYQAYLKAARRQGASVAAEGTRIGGLSRLEIYKLPGVFSQDLPVAVRAEDVERTRFASLAGSLIAGSTGDLVAARNNLDGLLVIERVLCKEATPDYRSCSAAFAKGRFDSRTGAELDSDFQPERDGARIDPTTYR